jgi:hypothetical protein
VSLAEQGWEERRCAEVPGWVPSGTADLPPPAEGLGAELAPSSTLRASGVTGHAHPGLRVPFLGGIEAELSRRSRAGGRPTPPRANDQPCARLASAPGRRPWRFRRSAACTARRGASLGGTGQLRRIRMRTLAAPARSNGPGRGPWPRVDCAHGVCRLEAQPQTRVVRSAATHPGLFVVLAYVISWAWAPALVPDVASGRGPHRRPSPTRRGRGSHPASTEGT